MAVVYDFRCPSGHVTEELVPVGTREIECPICGEPARYVILSPAKLDWAGMAQGPNAGPEFIDRFERAHRAQKDKEERSLAEHGDYGPRPGAD